MLFRQLFDAESSTYTYLLADEETHEAVLIDPVLEQVSRDVALVAELGLNVRYALDTHVHADHVTALGALRDALGCETVFSANAGVDCADRAVRQGDRLEFGGRFLEVRETPGHTNGCVTYVLDDRSMAFTGDALLIRGTGRTDFQQGSAPTLYRSIHEQIFSLPDEALLYPGHDYRGRTATTVGEEKRLNPRLGGGKSLEEFAAIMENLKLAAPKKIAEAVPANLACGLIDAAPTAEQLRHSWAPVETGSEGVPEVPPEWVAEHASEVRLVDVRDSDEYAGELGHIAGSELVPCGGIDAVAQSWDRSTPLVVVCASGKRSARAARSLRALGFERMASMRGGMMAWRDRRLPIER